MRSRAIRLGVQHQRLQDQRPDHKAAMSGLLGVVEQLLHGVARGFQLVL